MIGRNISCQCHQQCQCRFRRRGDWFDFLELALALQPIGYKCNAPLFSRDNIYSSLLDFPAEKVVSTKDENNLLTELKIMSCLGSHLNILNLFGACTIQGKPNCTASLPFASYGMKRIISCISITQLVD